MTPKVILLSFWRDDADRDLIARARHLLAKTGIWRWIWVVGDSSDETERLLQVLAPDDASVIVIRLDTGIVGEDLDTRRLRISATETLAYAQLARPWYAEADYIIQHESDLRSPVDVAARLLVHAAPDRVIAGWPTLDLGAPEGRVFYDIWAYRHLDGTPFDPYTTPREEPFAVSSVGSVWLAPAAAWHGRVIQTDCCVELCAQWQAEGLTILVDPSIAVEQPCSLWVES